MHSALLSFTWFKRGATEHIEARGWLRGHSCWCKKSTCQVTLLSGADFTVGFSHRWDYLVFNYCRQNVLTWIHWRTYQLSFCWFQYVLWGLWNMHCKSYPMWISLVIDSSVSLAALSIKKKKRIKIKSVSLPYAVTQTVIGKESTTGTVAWLIKAVTSNIISILIQ